MSTSSLSVSLFTGILFGYSIYHFTNSQKSENIVNKDDEDNDWIPLTLTPTQLSDFTLAMHQSLSLGLNQDVSDGENSSLAQIPSHVTRLPTGQESGRYLALDCGGTNLRVMKVSIDQGNVMILDQKKWIIPDTLKTGKTQPFFQWMAECVETLVDQNDIQNKNHYLPLGFTFSFPVKQTALHRGTLLHWAKDFSINDIYQRDLCGLLQQSLDALKCPVRVTALVNDTVGTLMASAVQHENTVMAVILGTGTNAAYVEKLSFINKLTQEKSHQSNHHNNQQLMILNTEWGAFDAEACPFTRYDNQLDEQSQNRHQQRFEKMVSGKYLGELVRLILVEYWKKFYGNQEKGDLFQHYALDSSDLSNIVADNSLSSATQVLLRLVGESALTRQQLDRTSRLLRRLSEWALHRSAQLAGAAMTAVLELYFSHSLQQETEKWTIAVDGSLFEYAPQYKETLKETLNQLLGKVRASRVKLVHARDGSGLGAAVIAAVMGQKEK